MAEKKKRVGKKTKSQQQLICSVPGKMHKAPYYWAEAGILVCSLHRHSPRIPKTSR